MSEPITTLTVTNVEVLPTLGELANVAVKVSYEWTATPDVGEPLKWPGIVELGEADPEYFTDLSTLNASDFQDVVGGWVLLELGRGHVRGVKKNMATIIDARATSTVPFTPPEA